MQRIIVVGLGCLLIFATDFLILKTQSIAEQIGHGLLGETWYRIEMDSQHVGFMHNNAYRDAQGRWHFATTTHFRLDQENSTTINKHLVFAARQQNPLHTAQYQHKRNGQTANTVVSQTPTGYKATLNRQAHESTVDLDWQFGLNDYVGLEAWLATQHPKARAEKLAPSADFEKLRITQRGYRVVELNQQGYLIENNAPLAANRIQLDHQFRPAKLFMAGTFNFVATDEADAIALGQLRGKTDYLFPLDQRLTDHTQLETLQIKLKSQVEVGLPSKLTLQAGALSQPGAAEKYVGEELRYPLTLPVIQSLVQSQLRKSDQPSMSNLAYGLVDLAHQQLLYTENRPAGSVSSALQSGRGECTDFADLYTTLARAAKLPARTVYGLVYKDSTKPGFVFHAWNEVYFDDSWHSVDPTWNQTTVDATHLPLTDAQAGAIMLAQSNSGVRFELIRTRYFDS